MQHDYELGWARISFESDMWKGDTAISDALDKYNEWLKLLGDVCRIA